MGPFHVLCVLLIGNSDLPLIGVTANPSTPQLSPFHGLSQIQLPAVHTPFNEQSKFDVHAAVGAAAAALDAAASGVVAASAAAVANAAVLLLHGQNRW